MPTDTGINNKIGKVGLPSVVFMFTLDQIASMLNISQDTVMSVYLYYEGRSSGMMARHHMRAINIAPEGSALAEWRVSLESFRHWLSKMGFKAKDFTRL